MQQQQKQNTFFYYIYNYAFDRCFWTKFCTAFFKYILTEPKTLVQWLVNHSTIKINNIKMDTKMLDKIIFNMTESTKTKQTHKKKFKESGLFPKSCMTWF